MVSVNVFFFFVLQNQLINSVWISARMDNSTNSTIHVPPNGDGALPFTPLLAPSAIFTAIFGILLFLHTFLACKFRRYYGYSIGMLCGVLLEFLGYIAKLLLSNNRTDKNGYIM